MKKNMIKIGLLSLILALISLGIMLMFGRTYDVKFRLDGKSYSGFEVENETGEVLVVWDKLINDNYVIRVKAKKPGKVYLKLNHDDYQEGKMLYVHKSMIITDNNYFGRATGSEVIPISLSIILIYILFLLIKHYNICKKENMYQYKNIAYLGIIVFISIFTLNNLFSIYNYQGLFGTVTNAIYSASWVTMFLFPIAFITFFLVTISNIKLIKKEGLSLRNILGLLLGIFICFSTILPDFIYGVLMKMGKIDIYNLKGIGPYVYNFIETLIYLTIAYLECVLLGTIIIAFKAIRKKPSYDKDYIVILGCQIKKDGSLTPLLKERVDQAIAFRNEQLNSTGKDLIFIPSGGKGKDEIISEAMAMKNYLISEGIKEKNILLEDNSKNTYQNIKFSNKLIKEKNANVAFSTTNYHVLRAGLIAAEQGLKWEGVGSMTKAYFWINAFIREFIGTLYAERKKHIVVFIITIVIIMIMISVTYFANNI